MQVENYVDGRWVLDSPASQGQHMDASTIYETAKQGFVPDPADNPDCQARTK